MKRLNPEWKKYQKLPRLPESLLESAPPPSVGPPRNRRLRRHRLRQNLIHRNRTSRIWPGLVDFPKLDWRDE
jgi:hypothetical protein